MMTEYIRTYGSFRLKSKVTRCDEYYCISIKVYPLEQEQEIGLIKCVYWNEDGCLLIEDMDTHFGFRGKGSGLLRFRELMKILDENKLQLGKVVAEEVGAFSRTLESKRKTESFFQHLGFQKCKEPDAWSSDWQAEGSVLRNNLDEILKEKNSPPAICGA